MMSLQNTHNETVRIIVLVLTATSIFPLFRLNQKVIEDILREKVLNLVSAALLITYATLLISGILTTYIIVTNSDGLLSDTRNLLKSVGILLSSWLFYLVTFQEVKKP